MAQKDEYYFFSTALGLTGNLTDLKRAFYTANVSAEAAKNPEGSGEVLFLKKYIENQSATPVSNYRSDLYKQALTIAGITPTKSYNKNKSLFYLSDTIRTNYAVTLQSYIKSLSGLVAYYPMDETSGNMINRAPATLGSYDGTVTGATQGVAGQSGNSYSFDRVNDVVTVGTAFDPSYTDMTIGGIILVTTASQGNNRTLMAKVDTYAAGDMRWQASINNTNQFFIGRSGSTVIFSTYGNTYPKDAFFMFHIIKTAASTKLYINASLVETGAAFALSTDGASVFSIGARGSTPSEFFGGQMQHMQVFNVALAESAMTQMKTLAGL